VNNAAFDVTIPKDLGVSCAAVRDCVIRLRLGDDPCGIDPGSILDRYWIGSIRIDPKRNCPLGLKCPIIIGTWEELIAYYFLDFQITFYLLIV
jgi:hypothetical protein